MFEHFDNLSVFKSVFEDATAAEGWFIKFLNQTLEYSLQNHPIS